MLKNEIEIGIDMNRNQIFKCFHSIFLSDFHGGHDQMI